MIKTNDILIVDDTPANLHLLTDLLSAYGYKVRPATNGARALAAAQKAPPDLILLDIMMPEMNGYEVCARLKADPQTSDIPVIFISALDDLSHKVKAFEAGGVDYITKPFQPQEILARVHTHLSLRTAQKELEEKNKQLREAYESLEARAEELATLNLIMKNELDLARDIQQSLLPPAFPSWDDLEVACYTRPALEVGGDFYTYSATTKNRVLVAKHILAVGDVSGKGASAALLMATCLSQFQASLSRQFTPTERLIFLDKALMVYTKPRKQNCAMSYIEITGANTSQPVLKIVNAGCIPPYIRRGTGPVEWPRVGGFALGQGLGAKSGYEEIKPKLTRGDLLILTSDGVAEAISESGDMLGFDRLEQIVSQGPVNSAQAMLDHIKQELFAFIGQIEPPDDITVVVVKV